MVNVARLQDALREHSISYDEAATAMGIDRATFYRRLSRKGVKFTVEEVDKLTAWIGLTPQKMHEIFFDSKLA